MAAKEGLYLGPLKVYQCPKTMLTNWDRELVELPEIQKRLNIQVSSDRLSNRYVQLVKLVERERSLIIQQEKTDRSSKAFAQKGVNR